MKTYSIALAASAAALVTFAVSHPARALGPIDLEVAAKVGYGTDELSVGFGGRAGVSFLGLYGGVSVIDYIGQSRGGFTTHAFLYGGELGYGMRISVVTIRPIIGFGDTIFSVSHPAIQGASGSSSEQTDFSIGSPSNSFYLEPGGLIQLNFGHVIFGVDAGCLIFTNGFTNGFNASTGEGSLTEAFTIHGQVGVKF
jgi:hypothetical protein